MSALELRYRRLLSWFPREHRAVHEEEMIGVLMAEASPGQERPDLRDAADLVAGGLRMRVRRAFGSGPGEAWRDAVSVAAVVGAGLLFFHWIANLITAVASRGFNLMLLGQTVLAGLVVAAAVRNRRGLAVICALAGLGVMAVPVASVVGVVGIGLRSGSID